MFTLETLERIFKDEDIVSVPREYQIIMINVIGKVLKEKYGHIRKL